MATVKVRGSNPIWYNVDLDSNSFDDNYYIWFLQNTIPYLPSNEVFLDVDGVTHAPCPIRYLGNGTLPPDIFFSEGQVYRLEFRHNISGNPPSQSDPLIYLVENWVPNGASSGPIPGNALGMTDNQITNPQFYLKNFDTSLVLNTAGTYAVAPGWSITLTGSGTCTITQITLTDGESTKTNASYALRVALAGWSSAYLSQRFQANGVLWKNTPLNAQCEVRLFVDGPRAISGALYVSTGSGQQVTSLFAAQLVLSAFLPINEAVDQVTWNNTDIPPNAWVEMRINLPNSTLDITSVQILPLSTPAPVPFDQDSIQRQIDHTYNTAYPIVPVGAIIDFAGTSLPEHYLACNGASVSKKDYALLFAAIGNHWGIDDATTFTLPNLQGYVTAGSGGSLLSPIGNTVGSKGGAPTHTLTRAELPDPITQTATTLSLAGGVDVAIASGSGGGAGIVANVGGGNAHTIVQPTAIVQKLIRYQ
jgi:microcystin-dependent protein